MVEIAHLNMTETLCVCVFWTGLWLVQRDTPADFYPFIKSSQIFWRGQHRDFQDVIAPTVYSGFKKVFMTCGQLKTSTVPLVSWCYLCHGPVRLLQPALGHLQTSNELKGVCHLDTQLTESGSLWCKWSSLDVHTPLQWHTGNSGLVHT